jgi:transcriptional regulator with GAF, ATPase, and Fis domain
MQQTAASNQAYLIIQSGNRWTDVLRLLPDQSVLVGRASENQVVVKDERVSRHHAKFQFQQGGWAVQDLGSRNGTQVDNRTLTEPRLLTGGEVISVGGCNMTFTYRLAEIFASGDLSAEDATQATVQTERPAIVNRLGNSQWSSELDAGEFGNSKLDNNRWGFFYRLVFDLVQCHSEEDAASVALDRLLDQVGLKSGGVLMFDHVVEPITANSVSAKSGSITTVAGRSVKKSTPADSPVADPQIGNCRTAVLAARQAPGSTYHRVSDFLVKTVLQEKQALLARNIQDDVQLSVARASGQHEISSSLCAPLRVRNESVEQVIGLIHLYSQPDQRQLSGEDLDLAVGVADNLAIAIWRLRQNSRLTADLDATRRQLDQLEQQLCQSSELIGNSLPMQKVKQAILRAGPTPATVLVRGESGSGKELVARAIHFSSPRKAGPLVCLNCAALAPSLLESELFGHEKGAFTGATERKIGKFEAANRGTLFLDEVGEMPLELQAKFLRVLEGHPFERLGGNTAIHTDVRVIAATNRDLEEAVKEKQFRSDLYFRLKVVEIFLPPLRQRRDDIPALVDHFLGLFRLHSNRRISGFEPKALELLARHNWPGNVRELRNVIERAVVLGSESTLSVEDLNLPVLPQDQTAGGQSANEVFRPQTLEELEQSHILKMLEYAEGNKSKAAQLLGIERSTLDRKLKRFS